MDRFCDALISIREEIAQIEKGKADINNNVLKVRPLHQSLITLPFFIEYNFTRIIMAFTLLQGAPHPPSLLMGDAWTKPYSREYAAFPASWLRASKFWPTTGTY